jgi:hypothetical protein
MGFGIEHPDNGYIEVDQMPLYGVERAMGVDAALPGAAECDGRTATFKLYDDDGEYCYGGVLDDDEECLNQVAALRYGESDYGATRIEVRREGKWIQEIA